MVESLCNGFDPGDAAQRIVKFALQGHWTPHGRVFDIGSTTKAAVARLTDPSIPPVEAGPREESDNGNGSLMRILPIAFTLGGLPFSDRMERIAEMSSLTHGHPRSIIACTVYVEMALELLGGRSPSAAYDHTRETVRSQLGNNPEMSHFRRLVEEEIASLVVDEIKSEGYVIHTLEAAFWSLLTSGSYAESVLKAVNLGGDTDTTGAVTGGLAGIAYGFKAIPKKWVEALPRKMEIGELAERLYVVSTSEAPSFAERDSLRRD
jgi:ADP-ribosylglycohydrolase